MGTMRPRFRIAALAVAAASLILPARAAAATSSNWAGYVAHRNGVRYRTARAAWTVPAVDCASAGTSYSAAWIGLGGYHTDSAALEQAGTEADCSRGEASYAAWYELVPDASVTVPLTVRPGDRISSRVSVAGHDVTIRISDLTRGTTYAKTLVASAIDTTSAEWIVEAPSSCSAASCRVLPLADFATTTFTAARAVSTTGHEGVIDDPAWVGSSIDLAADASPFGGMRRFRGGGSGNATAGTLSASGGSFTVTFAPATTASSSPA
jgi:hypothetical protein